MKLICFLFLIIIGLYFITPARGEDFDFQQARSDLKTIMNVIRKYLPNDTPEFDYTGIRVENATTIRGFSNAGGNLLSDAQKDNLLGLPKNRRNKLKNNIATYSGDFYELVRNARVDSRTVDSPLTSLWRSLNEIQQQD